VAVGVDEDVLGLEVAVGNALVLVQEFENQDNLGGVELGRGLVEAAGAAQVAEDLAARTVVEDHVQRVERLEAGDEGGDERMAGDGGEDVALVAHVLDLLEADDVDLAQDLEGEDGVGATVGVGVAQAHQPDAGKGAGAERLDELEVVLTQHLGREADGAVERAAPVRQRLRLARAGPVHVGGGAVVERAGGRRGLLAVVVGVQQAVEARHHGGQRGGGDAGAADRGCGSRSPHGRRQGRRWEGEGEDEGRAGAGAGESARGCVVGMGAAGWTRPGMRVGGADMTHAPPAHTGITRRGTSRHGWRGRPRGMQWSNQIAINIHGAARLLPSLRRPAPLAGNPPGQPSVPPAPASARRARVQDQGDNQPAAVSIASRCPRRGPSHAPVEAQHLGEDENQHHAHEDARLAHECAHALVPSAAVPVGGGRAGLRHRRRCQSHSRPPGPIGRRRGRPPCA